MARGRTQGSCDSTRLAAATAASRIQVRGHFSRQSLDHERTLSSLSLYIYIHVLFPLYTSLAITTAAAAATAVSPLAPYIFPNGTVIMLARGKDAGAHGSAQRNIHLYRASSWNATYEWVPSNGPNGTVNIGDGKAFTEDPALWRGRRGFHALLHSHPHATDTQLSLTHAWSVDGIAWDWSPARIGPAMQPGGDNERPRVVVDDEGDIAAVFVGQLVEAGHDASRTAAFVPNKRK